MVGNMEARIRDEKMTRERKHERERERLLFYSHFIILKQTNKLVCVEVEAMRKEMYEEAKAQFELNLKLIQEANVTFEERVNKIANNMNMKKNTI